MAATTEPRIRFLVGGAQKAGTTALARYLSAHPRLRLPRGKEAHVFDAPDFDEAWTPAEIDRRYAAHFDDADAGALHGDATPIYMAHPRLVRRIARYNPGMRWILLLREPAERAISQYHMEHGRGDEHWPLWAAMLLERWRLRGHLDDFSPGSPFRHHSYRLRGDYARQLDALYAAFPREQVLLLYNHELRADPAATVRRVCGFLDVEPPAGEVSPQTVFAGHYRAGAAGLRLVRWLMRGELRAMRERHGIRFDR